MITMIFPYYDNPEMLRLHYKTWHDWPGCIREQFKAIIVDDGSPTSPAIDVPCPANLFPISIYRVSEDRPWHQHAARNLGAHVADDGWLLMTDMDHLLTADNAVELVKRINKLEEDKIYTLHRVEADSGEPTLGRFGKPKPHPNSFVLTKNLYWKIGGYDEDFCGVYGTDGMFRARAFFVGKRGHLKRVALTRYWRELIPDASTTTLPRKEGRPEGAKEAIARAKWQRGEENVIKTLQFEWSRVL